MNYEPLQFSSVFLGEEEKESVDADVRMESREQIADDYIEIMDGLPENISIAT
jgi:hypothetical protein